MWPSACARKVFPTPTGPTIATWAWVSRKRSEVELVEEGAVEGHLGRGVPGLQAHGGVEVRALDAEGDGQALPAGDLVAEDQQQEILVRHLLLAREHEPLGQGVEHAREFEPTEGGLQIGADGVSGHADLLQTGDQGVAGARIGWPGEETCRAG